MGLKFNRKPYFRSLFVNMELSLTRIMKHVLKTRFFVLIQSIHGLDKINHSDFNIAQSINLWNSKKKTHLL